MSTVFDEVFVLGGIIRTYFFKIVTGPAVAENDFHYRGMKMRLLQLEIQEMDIHDLSLQREGGICHTNSETVLLHTRD